jgi:hypothetical protein
VFDALGVNLDEITAPDELSNRKAVDVVLA